MHKLQLVALGVGRRRQSGERFWPIARRDWPGRSKGRWIPRACPCQQTSSFAPSGTHIWPGSRQADGPGAPECARPLGGAGQLDRLWQFRCSLRVSGTCLSFPCLAFSSCGRAQRLMASSAFFAAPPCLGAAPWSSGSGSASAGGDDARRAPPIAPQPPTALLPAPPPLPPSPFPSSRTHLWDRAAAGPVIVTDMQVRRSAHRPCAMPAAV